MGADPTADRPTATALFVVTDCCTSSLYVFHSPQAGHLPIHDEDDAPQLLQTYTDLTLGIAIA